MFFLFMKWLTCSRHGSLLESRKLSLGCLECFFRRCIFLEKGPGFVWRFMGEIQTSGKPIDSLLEKVLCMNILSSDYFRDLYRLKTYHEVIDEIYNQVDHVEPWMTGNCRGPSTAFCLLYKFFTMKLTSKQMHGLLKHPDSPYIRAVSIIDYVFLAIMIFDLYVNLCGINMFRFGESLFQFSIRKSWFNVVQS